MRRTSLLLGLAMLSPISQPLLANEHEHQQLDAHQHGAAELNMVVEGEEVLIELISPADNILGFEHQATTEADRHKLEQAVATLRQGAVIQLTEAADCELESSAIESALLEDHQEHDHDAEHAEHDGHDDHEKHEEHAHDDHQSHDSHKEHEAHGDNHASEHSEFHVSYSYHCHKPDALNGAQLQLWQQFDGFEKIQVQLITPGGQQRQELTRSTPHIRF